MNIEVLPILPLFYYGILLFSRLLIIADHITEYTKVTFNFCILFVCGMWAIKPLYYRVYNQTIFVEQEQLVLQMYFMTHFLSVLTNCLLLKKENTMVLLFMTGCGIVCYDNRFIHAMDTFRVMYIGSCARALLYFLQFIPHPTANRRVLLIGQWIISKIAWCLFLCEFALVNYINLYPIYKGTKIGYDQIVFFLTSGYVYLSSTVASEPALSNLSKNPSLAMNRCINTQSVQRIQDQLFTPIPKVTLLMDKDEEEETPTVESKDIGMKIEVVTDTEDDANSIATETVDVPQLLTTNSKQKTKKRAAKRTQVATMG